MCEFLLNLQNAAGSGFGIDLLDTLQGETALTAACLHGHQDVVLLLIERDAHIEAGNCKHMPPLLCAAKAGHWELVDNLLCMGAPLEQTDKHGRTALMIAASEGHLGVLEMLLSKGEGIKVTLGKF